MNQAMTSRKYLKRTKGPEIRQSALIDFAFTNDRAKSVYIAGSFNDWHPSATEMLKIDDNRWFKELALAPGTYEYQFVVDGRWIPDPGCRATVPNPFAGINSVITIPRFKL